MKKQGPFMAKRSIGLWRACAVGFALIFMAAGCNEMTMNSDWRDRAISVDGDHIDWSNVLYTIESKNVSIGVMNDSSNLYICFVPGDRKIEERMMRGGMTLWLDSGGGKKKAFGIRYPLGMADGGMPMRGARPDRDLGSDEGQEMDAPKRFDQNRSEGESDFEIGKPYMGGLMPEFEIRGSEKDDVQRARSGRDQAIAVAVGKGHGRFVYELKIPLNRSDDSPYAVGVVPGSVVGIGFESVESSGGSGKMPEGRRGDGPGGDFNDGGGGMEGGGGGMPGGGGGMPGGGMGPGGRPEGEQGEMSQETTSLKLWLVVRLAVNPGKVDM